MTDRQMPGRPSVDDDDIGKLISLAGARLEQQDEPGPAAFAHAEAAWQAAVLEHKKRSRWGNLRRGPVVVALAACLAVAVFAGSSLLLTDAPNLAPIRTAASVLNATGDYRLTLAQGGSRAIAGSDQAGVYCRAALAQPCVDVPQGSLIVSGAGTFLWLELANSALLYAQPDSEMTLQNDGSIWLHAGRVYVDASGDSAQVTVLTKHSRVVDIGTEYEVSVTADETEIRTREGTVEVTTANARYLSNASAGSAEVVAFDGNGELIRTSRLPAEHSSWNWRRKAIAPFKLEGRSVADLVLWIARVEGAELDFATSNTRFSASKEILSGGQIRAENALSEGRETVNAATGFTLSKSGRVLHLERK